MKEEMMTAKSKLIEERIVYNYGLRYTISHWTGDTEWCASAGMKEIGVDTEDLAAANKYDINVKIDVHVDQRDYDGGIEAWTPSEEELEDYVELAQACMGVAELTEETEQEAIKQVEKRVGAVYLKLRNWKRQGRP